MKPISYVAMSLLCFVLAALVSNVAELSGIDDTLWSGAKDFLGGTSDLLNYGAMSFLAITIYAKGRIRTEVQAQTREQESLLALGQIRERIHPAMRGVEALLRIQVDGADIVHDGVESFSKLAQFCACWVNPKRRQWCDDNLALRLRKANSELFSFIVALDVQKEDENGKTPNAIEMSRFRMGQLQRLTESATEALWQAEKEICEQTGRPSPPRPQIRKYQLA